RGPFSSSPPSGTMAAVAFPLRARASAGFNHPEGRVGRRNSQLPKKPVGGGRIARFGAITIIPDFPRQGFASLGAVRKGDRFMAEEPHVLRGINWREAFAFTNIFRAFRIAIHPSKLVLALMSRLA